MADKIIPALILLTYKGKALLMNRQNNAIDEEKHPWCFISGINKENESPEETLKRRVEKETGIRIQNIKPISRLCYHAELSDEDVNNIQREENQLLSFFKPVEVSKLLLTRSSEHLFQKHSALIQ
jgi:NADH pyrophosphatase NudC (nudix superfamily)